MRIGIDLRPLQGETQYRGIGRSLEFFLETLSQSKATGHVYVLYMDRSLSAPSIVKLFPDSRIIYVKGSPLGRMRYVRSVLPSYPPIRPSHKDVDVLIQYDASLGVPQSVPTFVIFHDLIPYLFRNQEKKLPASGLRKVKNSLAGNLYWKKYLRVLKKYRHAAHIIAISEASKRDLIKHVPGVKESKVSVIPHGVRPLKDNEPASESVMQITQHPYLLYVGGIDLRKNIVGLLKTFFELKPKHPNLKLITVGKEFELTSQLDDLGWTELLNKHKTYAKDVIRPGFLSESDLSYMYKHASAFVFPSLYEGFGMPILEAMAAGCPVVAYSNSSIPEVAGEAAILLQDNQPMADTVEKLLNDKKLRMSLVKKGWQQVELFTWQSTTTQIIRLIERHKTK